MDEKLVIVHGVSCVDGVEDNEMSATDAVVRIFLDDHVELEWLVVCLSLSLSLFPRCSIRS